MSEQEHVVLVSRYCPTCRAQIKAWKLERVGGQFVERCIDCGNDGLVELREAPGNLNS